MENAEKDAVIRRIIEIMNLPTKIEQAKKALKENLHALHKTDGKGNEFTGFGTIGSVSRISEQLYALNNDLKNTEDIHNFFNSH